MKIKVIQLNIWRGEVIENALEFLKKEDADILLLEEVYDGKEKNLPPAYRLFEYLKQQLPEYHAVFGAQFCDITEYGNIDEGNALFSKFPIISSSQKFFDAPYSTFNNHAKETFDDNPQTILGATLDARGVELHAFCVHGIWGLDGRDTERRLKMGEAIIEQIKDKEHVILGGDFNLNPDTQTVSNIEQYVKSVFENTLERTFNLKYKTEGGYATASVDMMFHSKNMKVLSKDCLDIDVSDHLPLVVEFEL